MKSIVVYRSKSGNTKGIAEIIAVMLGTDVLPINLLEKRGRGSKGEREKEKEMFARALEVCKDADLVFVGTPVSFEQAHTQITRFVKLVETKNAGIYCTYIKKMGSTLEDLKNILKGRGIRVVGIGDFGNLNSGQFMELNGPARDGLVKKAEGFVQGCLKAVL